MFEWVLLFEGYYKQGGSVAVLLYVWVLLLGGYFSPVYGNPKEWEVAIVSLLNLRVIVYQIQTLLSIWM